MEYNRLKNFSDEELEKEVKKRRLKEEKVKIPKIKDDIDITGLKKLVEEYIEDCTSDEFCEDNDWDHWLYESVIETFIGKNFWEWYNNNK